MWIIIVALVVLIIVSLILIGSRQNAKPDKIEPIESRPCPEDCRPCPVCAVPIKRKATKCLYCGADLRPDLRKDFGGIALAPDAFGEVANFVNELNDYDAKNYLKENLGITENEARAAIYRYKREHSDRIQQFNWRPWVISACIAVVILIIISWWLI